jgi:hypothetical protein
MCLCPACYALAAHSTYAGVFKSWWICGY